MASMFAFHEVPPVIRVSSQCPSAEIGSKAGTAVECRISVAIVVGKVKEAVDTSIEGNGEMFWYGLPSVITLDEEETALIAGICLCLKEEVVLSGIIFHIAVGVQSPVAL